MIIKDEVAEIRTPYGVMRTVIYRPQAPGCYPGLVFFSEIFQITGPIARAAMMFAGHGMVVAVPEIYHELEEPGTVLAYDQEGSARGNAHKTAKELASYDADAAAVVEFLQNDPGCTGHVGAAGFCIGGHLAYRAAFHQAVRATVCFYPTDLHKRGLGRGMNDDSLQRTADIGGEMLMIWGRQDPHIPDDGRVAAYQALSSAGVCFTWHEFNAQHAFMRDEGHRYDPELARLCYSLALGLFQRRLGEGDQNTDS